MQNQVDASGSKNTIKGLKELMQLITTLAVMIWVQFQFQPSWESNRANITYLFALIALFCWILVATAIFKSKVVGNVKPDTLAIAITATACAVVLKNGPYDWNTHLTAVRASWVAGGIVTLDFIVLCLPNLKANQH